MRERAAATIFMWIAQAVSIGLILGSLKYTEIDPVTMIEQTVLVPDQWQLGAAILIFALILAAAGGTVAIWQGGAGKAEQQSRQQAEKAKRSDRDARIKRLLATMDDEELDSLEQERLSDSRDSRDEGDHLSLEALLRRRG